MAKQVSMTSFVSWFFEGIYNEHWVIMDKRKIFLEHTYVLTLNAGNNKAETGITVLT
jgi:hypothetical protein